MPEEKTAEQMAEAINNKIEALEKAIADGSKYEADLRE